MRRPIGTRIRLPKAAMAIVCLSFLFAAPALAACSPLATSKVVSNKTSYAQGDELDITYYYETDGGCTDADKPHVKITFNNQSGNLITVGETDCPKHDSGDGMFCELIGGKTFQFHVRGKFDFPGTAQKGIFEGWAYSGGDLKNKTYPPLEVGYAGSNAAGLTPAAAAKDPEPVEATLAIRIGGLTQTANIGLYLATVYNWGIPVVAILAVTMIAWGGIKWLTAGGDSGRVTSARTTISNAVVGLILAMATYLILSTVNPALTTFKSIEVPKVQRILAPMGTFCEDLLAGYADYRVDPSYAHCGTVARVSSVNPNTTVIRDTCIFKSCGEGEGVCGRVDKGGKEAYQCMKCLDLTDDKLAALFNVLPALADDSACLPYSPPRPTDGYSYEQCVYSNEGSWKSGDKGCKRLIVKDCKEVKGKGCGGYDDSTILFEEPGQQTAMAGWFKATKERYCAFGASAGSQCVPRPSDHFRRVCELDPCGVGGCKATPVDHNKVLSALGLSGDYWKCEPK